MTEELNRVLYRATSLSDYIYIKEKFFNHAVVDESVFWTVVVTTKYTDIRGHKRRM